MSGRIQVGVRPAIGANVPQLVQGVAERQGMGSGEAIVILVAAHSFESRSDSFRKRTQIRDLVRIHYLPCPSKRSNRRR